MEQHLTAFNSSTMENSYGSISISFTIQITINMYTVNGDIQL